MVVQGSIKEASKKHQRSMTTEEQLAILVTQLQGVIALVLQHQDSLVRFSQLTDVLVQNDLKLTHGQTLLAKDIAKIVQLLQGPPDDGDWWRKTT
jgi:uncharacterized membrane protein